MTNYTIRVGWHSFASWRLGKTLRFITNECQAYIEYFTGGGCPWEAKIDPCAHKAYFHLS